MIAFKYIFLQFKYWLIKILGGVQIEVVTEEIIVPTRWNSHRPEDTDELSNVHRKAPELFNWVYTCINETEKNLTNLECSPDMDRQRLVYQTELRVLNSILSIPETAIRAIQAASKETPQYETINNLGQKEKQNG